MEPNPSLVCSTIRRLRRNQVSDSTMDHAVLRYIVDNRLMESVLWPSAFMKITEAGIEYLIEHDPNDY